MAHGNPSQPAQNQQVIIVNTGQGTVKVTDVTDQYLSSTELYNRANALSREGRHEEAIKYYEAALQLSLDDASAYNNMATCYKRIGKLDEAEAAYRKALDVDPSYYRAHFRLACLMVLEKREEDARKELRTYLKAGATMAEAETMLVDLDESEQVTQLLNIVHQELINSVAKRPSAVEHAQAQECFNKGVRLVASDSNGSILAFMEAVRYDPNFGLAYRELGKVLYQLGKFEYSLRVSERAVRLLPDDVEAWLLYGERCFNLNHNHSAMKAYKRAYQIAPHSFDANLGLGTFLAVQVEAGNREADIVSEAEIHLKCAISANSSHVAPYFMLARFYKALGKLDSTKEVLNQILTISPGNSEAIRLLQQCG